MIQKKHPSPALEMATTQTITEKEAQALFLRDKQRVCQQLKKKLKRSIKSCEKCQQDLLLSRNWELVQHEALMLQSNLFRLKKGMQQAIVNDWLTGEEKEVALDPLLEPAQQIAKRFRKSKKLRLGITPLEKHLKTIEENIAYHQQLLSDLEAIDTTQKLALFKVKAGLIAKEKTHSKSPKESLPYNEFFTASGLSLWVGKSAKKNDALTFCYAKGSDWWLHVKDYPGSHVILRVPKGQEPDEESLKDAIQAAIFYSKANDKGEAEVCITQCKYVSRLGKSNPGKVQISKHKDVFSRVDRERLQQLKQRNRE